MSKYLFTSESVTEGHPDKVCDAISDAILDNLLSQDQESHVACETLATNGLVVVSGEVRSSGSLDVENIVRETLMDIGYTDEAKGMDNNSVEVRAIIHEQSPEIAQDGLSGTQACSIPNRNPILRTEAHPRILTNRPIPGCQVL